MGIYNREKDYFSILSPCVSVREYRGSAHRARGLNPTIKNSYGILQLFP